MKKITPLPAMPKTAPAKPRVPTPVAAPTSGASKMKAGRGISNGTKPGKPRGC